MDPGRSAIFYGIVCYDVCLLQVAEWFFTERWAVKFGILVKLYPPGFFLQVEYVSYPGGY